MPVNLVRNGSFEDDFEHWTHTGSTSIVDTERLDKSKSLKVVNGGAVLKDDPEEQFKTFAGDQWTFSAWFKNESFTGPGGLRLQKKVGSSWMDAAITSISSAHGSAWEKHTVTYTATADVIAIRVRIAFAGSGVIYVDDLQLFNNIESLESPVYEGDNNHPRFHVTVHKAVKDIKAIVTGLDPSLDTFTNQTVAGVKTFAQTVPVQAPTAAGHAATRKYSNDTISPKENSIPSGVEYPLLNGDFSSPSGGFGLSTSGNRIVIDPTEGRNSPGSLKITADGAILDAAATADNRFPAKEGEVWYAECWVKWTAFTVSSPTAAAAQLGATVPLGGGSNNYPAFFNLLGGWLATPSDGWVKYSGTVTIPAGGLEIQVRPSVRSASTEGTIWFDDIKMYRLSTPANELYYAGDKKFKDLTKSTIGLSNVDNTSDENKPVSTAQQAALDLKANTSVSTTLSGTQTIAGVKTFSSSPRFTTNSVAGYVWTATNTQGLGQWADPNAVNWDDVDTPDTFPPTIGTTSTTAAAGNHTHTKASIGLGNVDNTADLDKPISGPTQTALNGKVPTSRTISTTSPLNGGGTLSASRTIAIASQSIENGLLSKAAREVGICYYQTLGKREVGYGQVIGGYSAGFPFVLNSIRYRVGTADGSGSTTVEIRKNGVALTGSSGTASTTPTEITGSWSFAEGDILTVYISAVGTNPGNVLIADMVVYKV